MKELIFSFLIFLSLGAFAQRCEIIVEVNTEHEKYLAVEKPITIYLGDSKMTMRVVYSKTKGIANLIIDTHSRSRVRDEDRLTIYFKSGTRTVLSQVMEPGYSGVYIFDVSSLQNGMFIADQVDSFGLITETLKTKISLDLTSSYVIQTAFQCFFKQ